MTVLAICLLAVAATDGIIRLRRWQRQNKSVSEAFKSQAEEPFFVVYDETGQRPPFFTSVEPMIEN